VKLAIPKERQPHERRVAATPETVKKFIGLKVDVTVETGAGLESGISDDQFAAMGATIAPSEAAALADADIVLKVQRPLLDEVALFKRGAILAALMSPSSDRAVIDALAAQGVDAFALELVPRITRAQSMDVLSSQSNLAGYKAVVDAAATFGRAMPMMMTAAGTVAPARVFVFGAGVAGLQAIATAKRMGAIVSATDVRWAAKEQVESLGGKFVMVDSDEMKNAETSGGYAREMSDEFKTAQAKLIAETIAKQDIAICTALIPGRKAPTLLTREHVRSMKPGSVIVDLAAEQGGNCEATVPGEVAVVDGVTILGHFNVPSRLPVDSSALFARNQFNFFQPLIAKDGSGLTLDLADEILKASLLTHKGAIVHPSLAA
jgi:NAD(P) transhydrogenase subunit alpha